MRGLPSQREQRALFQVQEEQLVGVIKAFYVTLADVNRSGYADPLLESMQIGLAKLPATAEVTSLQAELEQWLVAREQTRKAEKGQFTDALEEYDDLLALNRDNPAVLYERARVLAGVGEHKAGLDELERVVAIINDNPTHISSEQLLPAVGRLLYRVEPKLGELLASSGGDYPQLAKAEARLSEAKAIEMVRVEAGPFQMGSESGGDEGPVHTVILAEFEIDRYEVTNAQYAACVDAGGCKPPGNTSSNTRDVYYGPPEYADFPMVNVDWFQAQNYCEWRGARLPTEAEWEKAARGSDERTYPWGEAEVDCSRANHFRCGGDTHQVGSHRAGVSPYGAYDMAGNVWEWVADAYDSEYYASSPSENPLGPEDEQNKSSKVLRGGSWGSAEGGLRAAYRRGIGPYNQNDNIGFRCVVEAGAPG
jgi:formylglycine-generating enzyme required for sulfatase activity